MEQNHTITPTHGLLSEDFKQAILKLLQDHPLDIQTKAIILDSLLINVSIAARQQSQKELEAYHKTQENQDIESPEKEAS